MVNTNKKLGVLTTYQLNNTNFGSYILGTDPEKIRCVARARGLNEVIESTIMEVETMPDYSQLEDDEFQKRLPEIIHSCSFLSFIALKAGTISIDEVVGDDGVLHELSHLLAGLPTICKKKSFTCARGLVKLLQDRAIGSHQPV
jgi:hypothetical protein